MKESHSASSPHSPSGAQGNSLGNRFTQLKQLVVKALATAVPSLRNHDYWESILQRNDERQCPADEFRRMSFKMRKSGNLKTAEEICSRGIALYPTDLRLAVEYAEIARVAGDLKNRITRWQHAVDLGDTAAPVVAYKHLAESLRVGGDFSQAERIVRRGLEIYPCEYTLMEKLAVILSNSGRSTEAIAAWHTIIKAHPANDNAPAYLHISNTLRNEGLIERAVVTLKDGLEKYPNDSKLKLANQQLGLLHGNPLTTNEWSELASPHPLTAHLFHERWQASGVGTLGFFMVPSSLLRQHIPAMLDFAECIPPPEDAALTARIDVYAVWGPPSLVHAPIREQSTTFKKPLLYLDSGFLSSPTIEGIATPALSVIICPESSYLDTSRPSHLENTLNSDTFTLTEDQKARALHNISSIISHRLSKFNHAPRIDLRTQFPKDGTQRILLVDQRIGGGSIHWSLGSQGAFERMWDTAIALPQHEILVKLHPETIANRHGSQLRHFMPNPLPKNVTVIDFDVNPFDLFDIVDQVFVCTSQLGFEAVMAGKEVHCFAAPFYSGWGFTRDHIAVPRRKKRRTVAEIFHLFYLVHTRYFVPGHRNAEIEDLIEYLVTCRDTQSSITEEKSPTPAPPATTRDVNAPLRILMVIPSGRYGATGRYLQNLSISLIQLGCEIMILAEGPCQKIEAGVRWLEMDFDGIRLPTPIRREIAKFAPHIIYENGVRSRAQRAALEAMALTDARFVMQSEDDDIQVHQQRQSEKAALHLVALDRPEISTAEIAQFLQEHSWNQSLHIFLNPGHDRWIEPLLRILCYRMASLHTAIWHPFAERLSREYGKPTLVIPPVASPADFHRIALSPVERRCALAHHGIDSERVVIFIGGALYNYSPEFAVFLEALHLVALNSSAKIALVVTSGRSSLPLQRMARERLGKEISFTDLGMAGDEIYMEMLKACDVVCSPGLPDSFNRYRLPSRLVKAMAMAKPVLTCRCGFGESLQHNENAFLMEGENPATWAEAIMPCLDPANRIRVGNQGLKFAREHFDSDRVAATLKANFEAILSTSPQSFADRITLSPDEDSPHALSATRPRPSIRFRNRFHSTLQFAIRALASQTHRIDTVLHIGAGKCGEFDDYCRLGARRIHLVEGSQALADQLRSLENTDATITVQQAIVSAQGGVLPVYFQRPAKDTPSEHLSLSLLHPLPPYHATLASEIICQEELPTTTLAEIITALSIKPGEHLLTLEVDGVVSSCMAATPADLLKNFRWVVTRAPFSPIHDQGDSASKITQILTAVGFLPITLPTDHSALQPAMLFVAQESSSICPIQTSSSQCTP